MLTIWQSACCAEVPGSHVKHLERCMTDLLEYLTVVLACETDMLADWQDILLLCWCVRLLRASVVPIDNLADYQTSRYGLLQHLADILAWGM